MVYAVTLTLPAEAPQGAASAIIVFSPDGEPSKTVRAGITGTVEIGHTAPGQSFDLTLVWVDARGGPVGAPIRSEGAFNSDDAPGLGVSFSRRPNRLDRR